MIAINSGFRDVSLKESEPKFRPGQLVRHRRYGYRGVIVAADDCCRADPTWYMSNKTQPKREQPWYHVLVHGMATCTYAAESSLAADHGDQPVVHPLVQHFFSDFRENRHIRNDEPWPV